MTSPSELSPGGMRQAQMPQEFELAWRFKAWMPIVTIFDHPTKPRGRVDRTPEDIFALKSTALSSPGATIYVSSCGSNSNDGMAPTPVRSLGAAIQLANAGGTPTLIYIKSGTYPYNIGDTNIDGVSISPAVDIAIIATDGYVIIGPFLDQFSTIIDSTPTAYTMDRTDICRILDLTVAGPYGRGTHYELPKVANVTMVRQLPGLYDPAKGVFHVPDQMGNPGPHPTVEAGFLDPCIPVGGAFYVLEGEFADAQPSLYVKGPNLAATAKGGGYAIEGNTLYIRRPDGRQATPENTSLFVSQARNLWLTNRTSIYLGIEKPSDELEFRGGLGGAFGTKYGPGPGADVDEKVIAANGVAFRYGGGAKDGRGQKNRANDVTINAVNGVVYLANCVASGAANDEFNFHRLTVGAIQRSITVNCTGFDTGRNSDDSSNGLTCHDSSLIHIDVAGVYYASHGGTVGHNGKSLTWHVGTVSYLDHGDCSGQATAKLGGNAIGYFDGCVVVPPVGENTIRVTHQAKAYTRGMNLQNNDDLIDIF